MNNQITLAYLDYDDLDALQVVSVVSFYESFIDGADPLDMQGYLQTQLTTEILAVELAQSTSKFIGIKDHQILIGYMKVNDEKDAIEIQRLYLLKDYQNKGLGQRLLDEANRYAKTKHKRYLRLAVYEKIMQVFVFMNVMDLKNRDQTFSFRKTRSYLSDFRKEI